MSSGESLSIDEARRNVLFESGGRKNCDLLGNKVVGYDFNEGVDYDKMFKAFRTIGFQASNLAEAVDIINEMVSLDCTSHYLMTIFSD